ncbi:unnamed protein product [Penicillium olsonii]|uniref:Bifunctional lycopene cyclase/phytoene synthase n=1 Tax=Penicillium olsonii TaxID=99116 RepID=A0A9W4MP69_PENOL|nr:unnamed protein product [Penicillium olsonii]
MGLDYVMFHFTYTFPLASILTVLYCPFFTWQDIHRISILVLIAVFATIPWDSYLIRNGIWSYPSEAVVGYTFFSIPLEELFFFVIQTYLTSLLYCILRRPLVLPIYLRPTSDARKTRYIGQAMLVALLATGIACCFFAGKLTYVGLILIWVCPVLILQWSLSCTFLIALPWKVTVLPVCLPTLYLWVADANAIRAGTWAIGQATKLDYQLWAGLEVEEAFFFLVTNLMVVGGLASIDYGFAIEEYRVFTSGEESPAIFSMRFALKSVVNFDSNVDARIIDRLSKAVRCLQKKSQSMFLGSALFEGNLRIDLIFLYSFCRVMDDLVDDSDTFEEPGARYWITRCSRALDAKFDNRAKETKNEDSTNSFIGKGLDNLQSSLDFLPVSRLPKQPLFALLEGFKTDLEFDAKMNEFPIHTVADLDIYASRVASTVAVLVLNLVYHHYYRNKPVSPPDHLANLEKAGAEMGKALQCVNIARDIGRDAAIHRVYIPTTWLTEVELTHSEVIRCPTSPKVYMMQQRMLDLANVYYTNSRAAIEELPDGVREPIRATVESYMEIGRVLRQMKGNTLGVKKLRLPLWRRLAVAWFAMHTSNARNNWII